MKKVLLINPHKLIPESLSVTQRPSPPLGLAYIAAVFENNYAVQVLDCVSEASNTYTPYKNLDSISMLGISFEKIVEKLDDHYDVIGFSFMFSNNWLVNRDLANHLRLHFPKALFIAGGEHVSAIPEYCLNDCQAIDVVVTGEGEETIEELSEIINQGTSFENIQGISFRKGSDRQIIHNPNRKRIRSLDEILEPAWHLFPLDQYFSNNLSYGIAYGNSLPLFSTRGCPYECTFCSSPQMWGKKYSMRKVENVVEEIKRLHNEYKVTNFDFYDLTAIINKKWILEFCRLIIENGLKITWQIPAGTRAEAIDYEVSKALFDAGCKNITYAPESGSERMLESVKKRVKLDKMLFSIKESNRAGLNVKLNIIMGYPDEKLRDIMSTIWFLVKASYAGANDASPSIFSPYPGSELFEELLGNKELELSDDYFEKIVSSESFHGFINYNRHNSKATMIAMQYLGYLVFYLTNYVFRPKRLFSLLKNLYTGKSETRGEWMLKEIFGRFKYSKQAKQS